MGNIFRRLVFNPLCLVLTFTLHLRRHAGQFYFPTTVNVLCSWI